MNVIFGLFNFVRLDVFSVCILCIYFWVKRGIMINYFVIFKIFGGKGIYVNVEKCGD